MERPNSLLRLASLPVTEPDEPMLLGAAAIAVHVERQNGLLQWHLERCGAPPRLAALVVAGLQVEGYSGVSVARRWMDRQEAKFLLMAGAGGSGKTTAAIETLRTVRKAWWGYDSGGTVIGSWQWAPERALYVTAVALSSQASWSEEGAKLWLRARNASLLVIDDLGVESTNDRSPFVSDFQDLIDFRHGAEAKRTVLTTNLDSKTIDTRYGPRVLGRIRELGVAVSVGNESKRGRLQ